MPSKKAKSTGKAKAAVRRKPRKKAEPAYTLQVTPAGGRSRKATIRVCDAEGHIVFGDREDLESADGRRKAARRIAERLDKDAATVEKLLEAEWTKALGEQSAAQESPEGSPPPDPPETPYFVEGGRHCRRKFTMGGEVAVEALCNFACKVVEESVLDDGSGEVRQMFTIEGTLADARPLAPCQVSAPDFMAMAWPVREWGMSAIVNAGQGAKDHLRAAIQHASKDAVRRTVYLHTGWRRIGDAWVYLHAGGAIGADGPVADVAVSLEGTLAQFRLPDPPTGEELIGAVRASLALLNTDLAPDRLTVPLLAAVYRAPLGQADCSLAIIGRTGAAKSEFSALGQQHYGPGMDRLHLPGSWVSTGNSLEAMAFQCKDALLVIDDFKPGGGRADIDRMHALADRVLRAQGNLSGRARCRADGSLRPAKPPRGLIVCSGETDLRGESLQARSLTLAVARGDVSFAALTGYQRDAAAGLYAQSMSAYVQWLAPQYEDIRGRLRDEHAELRAAAAQERQHMRVPGIVADLHLGLRYFLTFAQAVGAIDADEKAELEDRGWRALMSAAEEQAKQIRDLDPARRFLQLLGAALVAGRAHLAAKEGGEPRNPEAHGWREEEVGTGQYISHRWKPLGACVGWVDEENLYLEPEASYAEVQALAEKQGEVIPLNLRGVRQRLKEHNLILSHEPGKLTRRRMLQGLERVVIHLHTNVLSLNKPGGSGGSGGVPPDPPEPPGFSEVGRNGVLHNTEDADAAAWQAATEQPADVQRF
jgi:hypothetical protein